VGSKQGFESVGEKVMQESEVKVLTGNEAAAYGVLLCRPDVICAYPITPQSEVVTTLSQFSADGLLDAEMVEVEGELSAQSVLLGAAAAGARTFTATAEAGLFFMYQPYDAAATSRFPIVMVTATREAGVVSSGEQDIFQVKDTGWIQIHACSCQEVLDSIIMAYKVAEDPEILVPINIAYDGWFISYLSDRVEIPSQDEVDRFLPKVKRWPVLTPDVPMRHPGAQWGVEFNEFRRKHLAALQRVKDKIEQIEAEFQEAFGRSYGGLIQEYRMEDAEIVLVAVGSCAATARVVVDKKREEGLKVGLIRIRVFRPFPREKLAKALKGKKAIGVIDRNVCYGWNCGTLFMELKAALFDLGEPSKTINFIDGLCGLDITKEHIERAVDLTSQASQGEPIEEVTWLSLE